MQENENGQNEGTEEKKAIECSQAQFNAGILAALASLREGEITHDERVRFLSWAEWQIQQEMEIEKDAKTSERNTQAKECKET